MNIKPYCYVCIFNQVYNITRRLDLDDETSSKVIRSGAERLKNYDLSFKPPIIAEDVYSHISKLLNKEDLFEKEKKEAIKEALKFKNILVKRIEKSKNPLFDACKVAIAGNVIDLGVNQEYNLEKEIKKIFEMNFYKNDFNEFEKQLKTSKTLCYLADNAGENVFDEILIKTIKEINPKIKVYYVVRGRPIINDVTLKDIEGLEINSLAEIIDSKLATPGFCLEKASKISKDIFYNSDMVISKGMGNFECLYEECNREVFYLFKVKCDVVAKASNSKKGEYMLFKGLV